MTRRAVARVGLVVAILLGSLAAAAPVGAAPAWRFVPTAPGAPYGHLSGVACPTVSVCFAVGVQDSGAARGKVIQRWNGTKWTVAATDGIPFVSRMNRR